MTDRQANDPYRQRTAESDMTLGALTGQGGDANDVSLRSGKGQEGQTGQQRVGPARWVHGEHPERSRQRLGEEPPLITAELRTAPDRADP